MDHVSHFYLLRSWLLSHLPVWRPRRAISILSMPRYTIIIALQFLIIERAVYRGFGGVWARVYDEYLKANGVAILPGH